jgi:hypothetical protein
MSRTRRCPPRAPQEHIAAADNERAPGSFGDARDAAESSARAERRRSPCRPEGRGRDPTRDGPDFVTRLEAAAEELRTGYATRGPVEWTQQAPSAGVAGQMSMDRSGAVFATWHGVTAVAFVFPGMIDRSSAPCREPGSRCLAHRERAQQPFGGFGDTFATIHLSALPMGVEGARVVEIRRGPLPAGCDLSAPAVSECAWQLLLIASPGSAALRPHQQAGSRAGGRTAKLRFGGGAGAGARPAPLAPATASGSSLPSVLPYPLNRRSPKERWRGRRLRREQLGTGPIWKPQRPQRQSHRHRRTRSRRRRCPINRARHRANRANRRSRAKPVRWEPSSGAALAVHGPYSQSCGPSRSLSVRSAGRGSMPPRASRFCWSVAASAIALRSRRRRDLGHVPTVGVRGGRTERH